MVDLVRNISEKPKMRCGRDVPKIAKNCVPSATLQFSIVLSYFFEIFDIKKSIVQASQKHNIFCSGVFDYRDNQRLLADFGVVPKKCPVRNAPLQTTCLKFEF